MGSTDGWFVKGKSGPGGFILEEDITRLRARHSIYGDAKVLRRRIESLGVANERTAFERCSAAGLCAAVLTNSACKAETKSHVRPPRHLHSSCHLKSGVDEIMYCLSIVDIVSLEKTQPRGYLKRRTTRTRQAGDYDIRSTQASCHLQSLHINYQILSVGAEIGVDVRDSLMSFL